jgi:hypothetical protein
MIVATFTYRSEEGRIAILRDGREITHIPLEELKTAAGVAFWWRQLGEKSWMTPELMKRLGQTICGHLRVC